MSITKSTDTQVGAVVQVVESLVAALLRADGDALVMHVGEQPSVLTAAGPIVLTSGYSNVLAENAHHGFDLIQKPYSVEALSRVLKKAISGKAPACTATP